LCAAVSAPNFTADDKIVAKQYGKCWIQAWRTVEK